jgi:CRP-like cAMP-binding protein
VIEKHLMKLRARDELSAQEEQAIRDAVNEIREYPADLTFIEPGEELQHSTLLLEGIMCRYKDLSAGQRQITELHVAGDFADLHSFTLKRLDHSVMTLSPCRVAILPHDKLGELSKRHPHLTRLYWFGTNLDAAIHREWAVSLGRRNAAARLAHLFCEMHLRLGLVGLVEDGGFSLPLTQTDLAECLGLTSVHVNRTLKELRERGLMTFKAGRAEIIDLPGLQRAAEFDPAYLYLERRSR